MATIQNKGNISPMPIEHYKISASEVVKYLQNELGIGFDCDFKVLDNRAPYEKPMATEKCYVIMRCVFRPEDICVSEHSATYVDKVLQQMGSGKKFKDNVISVLEKFMFPENMRELAQKPDKAQQLASQGLYGPELKRLIDHPRFFYDKTNDRFGIALRPECIIKDMLRDVTTNTLDGIMNFGYLDGNSQNTAAVTWGVNVYRNVGFAMSNGGITIDAVFDSAK